MVFFSIFLSSISAQEGNNDFHQSIFEEGFVTINGIEQWVTIKGDRTKPVILFIHGGPGNPMSPFADAIYGNWAKEFVLVQWDQRGTGKTYGYDAPVELTAEYIKSHPLTIEQMTSDGIELAQYLIQRLGKTKIILFGSSWGSVLGVKMAIKKPELFYAYIGHSQIVNYSKAEQIAYKNVYEKAKQAKDQKSLEALSSIGPPPYEAGKSRGQLNRIIQKYQQENSIAAPASWFVLADQYDNKRDNQNRLDGEDYSFVSCVGDKKLGVVPFCSTVNFLQDGLTFNIPVYLIQGEQDIQTPAVITKEYFNKLSAPRKKIIILPNTAHGFNQPVIDAQYKILSQDVLPFITAQK
jgi:pimeloyl-ACP methyl ester carboxylesterase